MQKKNCSASIVISTFTSDRVHVDLAMLSTMISEYTITEGPYNLRELASKVKLPQVVLVTQGFYGATEKDTVSGGQMMVAFFIKRVKGVTGIHKKLSFHIPLNSAMQFAPVPSEGTYRSCTSTTNASTP